MKQPLETAVGWLRRAGFDVRPWDSMSWCITGPHPAPVDLVTSAEIIARAHALQASFRPLRLPLPFCVPCRN